MKLVPMHNTVSPSELRQQAPRRGDGAETPRGNRATWSAKTN